MRFLEERKKLTCLDLTLDIKYKTITLSWFDINVVWSFYGSWVVTYTNERIVNHIRNEQFLCRYFCVCVETARRGLAWVINYAAISIRLKVVGKVGVANRGCLFWKRLGDSDGWSWRVGDASGFPRRHQLG